MRTLDRALLLRRRHRALLLPWLYLTWRLRLQMLDRALLLRQSHRALLLPWLYLTRLLLRLLTGTLHLGLWSLIVGPPPV